MSFTEGLQAAIEEGIGRIQDRRSTENRFRAEWEEKKKLIAEIFADASTTIAPSLGPSEFNRKNGGYFLDIKVRSGQVVAKSQPRYVLEFNPNTESLEILCKSSLPAERFEPEPFKLDRLDRPTVEEKVRLFVEAVMKDLLETRD